MRHPRHVVMLVSAIGAVACGDRGRQAASADTTFVRMQARGAVVMGVNQYTSAHVFEDLPDGGRIIAEQVPGTAVMAARSARIAYQAIDRPRGAEVRIVTTDPTAVSAVHAFLAFQRGAHHAAGHEAMP